jgi:hypothetical protein
MHQQRLKGLNGSLNQTCYVVEVKSSRSYGHNLENVIDYNVDDKLVSFFNHIPNLPQAPEGNPDGKQTIYVRNGIGWRDEELFREIIHRYKTLFKI